MIAKGLLVWFLLAFLPAIPVGATTYVVNNTNDSGPGSLRLTISGANANAGADSIHFNIPGEGPHTIRPASPLPEITEAVVIDGYTQPGALPATPTDPATLKIELDGSLTGVGNNGLAISGGNSTVRGLVVNRFENGINDGGIYLDGNGGNIIEGNYIGTDVTGTVALGYIFSGVHLEPASSANTIGGATEAARNVIGGNLGNGIWIESSGNVVQGNYIGIGADGATQFNSWHGIVIYYDSNNNMVGGTASGQGNLIMNHYKTGIVLLEANDNAIVGNTVAHNDEYGVNVMDGIRNPILFNSIYDNWPLGIELGWEHGVDQNDNMDGDGGPNMHQNYPVLLSAITDGNTTTIQGTLNSTPNTAFHLQFFSNTIPNPSGYGEGEKWIDSTSVTTDDYGNAQFSVAVSPPVPETFWVTGTATDPDGNTSEFCQAILSEMALIMDLSCELITGTVVLSWTEIPGAPGYWVYGASNHSWFAPDMSPPTYVNRLAVMPAGITTWSSSNGVGDPDNNWTYLVVAVDASNQEIVHSNYCGEHDFQGDIP